MINFADYKTIFSGACWQSEGRSHKEVRALLVAFRRRTWSDGPINTQIEDMEGEERDDNELLLPAGARRPCSLAGALLWIARRTNPDIHFAVHRLTR